MIQDDYCINCDNQTNCSKVEMCERTKRRVVMEEKGRYKIKDRWLVDTENNYKQIYAIDSYIDRPVIDLLNQQDKRIKELEQENLFLKEQNQQLKQQLHELPKKIVEEITNELSNNTSLYFEIRESTSAHCPNKEYEWFNYVRFRNYINTILKKYGGEI